MMEHQLKNSVNTTKTKCESDNVETFWGQTFRELRERRFDNLAKFRRIYCIQDILKFFEGHCLFPNESFGLEFKQV